ncbi:cytochrome c oxidase assembly protein [Paracoccus sp. (in: a-proteobacteria)]|uniref:cytochrome c oxidase assembly protein n=1 Tax=Paracoccus sp. TaxID=267 RepID=UPI0026DFD097|nr:cytochrome c oxidase assembly protein [Paracoccus sp. (in: a-proteobacteria)]MDO5646649.1 cytochrome c oxidase assembly protein [Paracoccus sp. (in: a-proteobacteria)]
MPEQDFPYCGPAPFPGNIWAAWNTDPLLLAGLAMFGAVLAWRAVNPKAAAIAWAGLILAFVSPLCALTVALFSARAAHHLVIVTLAAPALAIAWPMMSRVPAALSLAGLTAVMVAWNLPLIYTAMWGSDAVYWALQLAMLGTAWAFWSAVLSDGEPIAQRALLTGGLAGVMGLIGAILTFAPNIMFFQHIDGAVAWGLDPLADQQLAGLVMWVPGFVPVAVIAALMLRRGWQRGFAA